MPTSEMETESRPGVLAARHVEPRNRFGREDASGRRIYAVCRRRDFGGSPLARYPAGDRLLIFDRTAAALSPPKFKLHFTELPPPPEHL